MKGFLMTNYWICGYEGNPNSPEYGEVVQPNAMLYSSGDISIEYRTGIEIPHGTKIDVLEFVWDNESTRVRYKGTEGYVQTMLITDYDPSEGSRPHPLHI